MNGFYVEHYIDGSSPVLVFRCVTCGALIVPSDEGAHSAFHAIIKELANMAYPQQYEVEPPPPPPPPPDVQVATGSFTMRGGAKGG